MTISVTDTATGQELTVNEVKAALGGDTPIFDSTAEHPGAGDEWRRQAGLSRARFDGMGIGEVEVQPSSVQWAELPAEPDPVAAYMAAEDPDPRPGRWVNLAEDDLLPARIVRVGDTNLPRRNDTFERRGWTPEPRPAITETEDHGAVDRWLKRTEQRLRQSRFGRWLGERFTPVKEER